MGSEKGASSISETGLVAAERSSLSRGTVEVISFVSEGE